MTRPFLLLTLLALIAACTSEGEAPRPDGPTTYVAGPEATASDLARMMRDMTAFADSTNARLQAGRDLPPYPAAFKGMLTATPTPGMVDHRTFDPFAFAFLHQLDSLYSTPVEHRAEVFNAVVAGCAACHGQVCPGPLVRINKLYLR